jgi:hypothetical protein
MEIPVIHPTLEEYSNRVNSLAAKYGKDSWMAIDSSILNEMEEDDRHEFSFIKRAVGDQLFGREFEILSAALNSEIVIDDECEKPGVFPGFSFFAGVELGRERVQRLN